MHDEGAPCVHRLVTVDPNAHGNAFAEFKDLFGTGIDGLFSDQSDLAFAAREDFLGHRYGVEQPQATAS